MVDVLGAIVGMEAKQGEGECLQELFQRGDKVAFADFFDTAYRFKLRHFIDGVDVVDAFLFVLIALMYGLYTNIARFTLGLWFATFANGGGFGTCGFNVTSLACVEGRAA